MNRRGRLVSLLVLACALPSSLFALGDVRAQPAPTPAPAPTMASGLDLEWQAPAGCPDRAALLVQLAHALGREPRADDPPLRVRGRVVRARTGGAEGYRLELQTAERESTGQRTLADPSCTQLTNAAALVLATVIDDAARATPSAPPAPTASVAPTSEPEPIVDPEVARPSAVPDPPLPPPRLRVAPGVRVQTSLDFGTLPFIAAPSVGLAGFLDLGPARVELAGAYWFAQTGGGGSAPAGVSAEISMAAGRARGCFTPVRPRVRFGACGGFEAGAQFGRGVGNSAPIDGQGLWVAALAGGFFEVRVASVLWFHLGLDAVIPPVLPEFVVEDSTVFQSSRFALRGTLGVGVHFP